MASTARKGSTGPIKSLRKIGSDDEAFNRFQDSVAQTLTPVLQCPLLDGVLLQGIELNSSAFTNVEHRLGREYRGWLVVRKSADANVYEDFAQTRFKSTSIPLKASATVTVDLWVF